LRPVAKRKWIGVELGPLDEIIQRFDRIDDDRTYLDKLRRGYNHLFLPEAAVERRKRGLWTSESVRKAVHPRSQGQLQLESVDPRFR